MAGSSILINQAGKPAGLPSTSREDLDLFSGANSVVLTNNNDTGVSAWSWVLVDKPNGSVATLTTPALASSSFNPDVRGSYLIRLTVTDGSGTPVDERIAAVVLGNGWRIPSAFEKSQFNTARGWAQELDEQLRDLEAGRFNALELLERAADPTLVANKGHLYAKDIATITQLFYRASDGTVTQLTGPAGVIVHSLQDAYDDGSSVLTNGAQGDVVFTRGGSHPIGQSLLSLVDANASAGRTVALFSITDANVVGAGAPDTLLVSRSVAGSRALRVEVLGAADVLFSGGQVPPGTATTCLVRGDGSAVFGGAALVGSERLRVTGSTTLLDFTSTTALTVAQTGGGAPALVVDTTNTRIGVGAAPGAFTFDVTGTTRVSGAATLSSTLVVTGTSRSAGHLLAEQGGDPVTAANEGSVYTKVVAGVTQLFYRADSNGAVSQLTPPGGGGGTMQAVYDTGPGITTDPTGVMAWARGLGHPPGVGSQLLTFTDANAVADRTLALLDISDTNVPVTDPDAPSLRITRSQTSGQVAIHLARTGTALGPGAQAPSSKLQLSASIWDVAATPQTRTYSLLNSVTVAAESATNVAARLTLMHGTTAMADFFPRDLVGAIATLVISPRAPAGVVPALTLRAQGAYATNGPLFSVENANNANNQIVKLAVGALDLKVQDNVAIGYRLNLALVKNLGAGLGVDNDEGGSVYFQSPDSAGTLRDIAQVRGATVTAAAATLRGRLELYAATQGALNVLLAEVMGDTAGATATRAGLIVRSRVTAASGAVPFTFRAQDPIADANVLARWQDTDTTTLAELRGGGNWMALGSLGVGFVTGSPNARVDIDGDIAYRVVSPAALAAGDNNDYAGAAGRSFARLTPDAGLGSTITGIAGGQNGRILIIVNLGAQTLVIANANGNSVAANQILTGTGDVSLGIDDSITLIYDSVTSRWRRIASAT